MAGSDVLVVGAGPAGLAAVSAMRARGLEPAWIDREGAVGGAYREVYPGMELSSPTRYNALPGLPLRTVGEYTRAGDYYDYLRRLAAAVGRAPERAELLFVRRQGACFVVTLAGGEERGFSSVVVATGMFDFPKSPSIPGLGPAGGPSVRHAHASRGAGDLRGKSLLVVGGGVSGVELAEDCAKCGVPVTVSARGGRVKLVPQRLIGRDVHDFAVWVERLPLAFFRGFCASGQTVPASDLGFSRYVREGKIVVTGEVERFEGKTAIFADGSRRAFDAVVLATGYRFETPFLPAEVERAPAGHPRARGGESVSWPGLYFIGFPCSRALDSQYLRGMAKDAEALARRLS